MRKTFTSRIVKAGCFVCNGGEAIWHGPNAQAVAARHHDATGHETWADVHLFVSYGNSPKEATELRHEKSRGR